MLHTYIRPCSHCSKPFTTQGSIAWYCSATCSLLGRAKIVDSGCWEWQGGTDWRGYGRFHWPRMPTTAHRASYLLLQGHITPGQCVLHRCDNPRCINPEHLRAGTQLENVADMVSKNRAARQRGEKSGNAKLSWEAVGSIRELYAKGDITQAQLGLQFGVSRHTVSDVTKQRSWTR